jgi:hypothetical protein
MGSSLWLCGMYLIYIVLNWRTFFVSILNSLKLDQGENVKKTAGLLLYGNYVIFVYVRTHSVVMCNFEMKLSMVGQILSLLVQYLQVVCFRSILMLWKLFSDFLVCVQSIHQPRSFTTKILNALFISSVLTTCLVPSKLPWISLS